MNSTYTRYKEHYKHCRKNYSLSILNQKVSNSVYDLTVNRDILGKKLPKELILPIKKQIDYKINNNKGCFIDDTKQAIRVNEWHDIKELNDLANFFMPILEEKIFNSYAKIEFLHPYRNLPSLNTNPMDNIPMNVKSSWKWHYDDCPDEFLKLFIYLNKVTKENGCLKYLQNANGDIPKIPTYRKPNGDNNQIYLNSRVPDNIINNILSSGGKIINVLGPMGSYAIHSANIIHRASTPLHNVEPRDVLFFFIRPSLKKQNNYLENTYSYLPERNVKKYPLN